MKMSFSKPGISFTMYEYLKKQVQKTFEVSMSNKSEFLKIVDQMVKAFSSNAMVVKLESGCFEMADYHAILHMLFHQTYEGPSTFALAGAHCDPRLYEVRDYLLHHADEEKNHWQWVIHDLENTGYTGKDPRELFPHSACQAYIAFNVYVSLRHPLSRLAIATVLESIGANHGKRSATAIGKTLQLKPNQLSFFFGHGDTDVGHTEEILKVIDSCPLTTRDWQWMCHAARTAGELYINMYNEAARQAEHLRPGSHTSHLSTSADL